MSLYTGLLVWYILGAFGCWLGCYTDWKNGSDITVSEIIASIFVSLFGPLTLLTALAHFLSRTNFADKVIIRGKK